LRCVLLFTGLAWRCYVSAQIQPVSFLFCPFFLTLEMAVSRCVRSFNIILFFFFLRLFVVFFFFFLWNLFFSKDPRFSHLRLNLSFWFSPYFFPPCLVSFFLFVLFLLHPGGASVFHPLKRLRSFAPLTPFYISSLPP